MNSLATISYQEGEFVDTLSTYSALHSREIAMVRSWRSVAIENANIRIDYQAGLPVFVNIYYDNMVTYTEPYEGELSESEINCILVGRQLYYGSLDLLVSYGVPIQILGGTFKRIRLADVTDKPIDKQSKKE